MFLGKVILPLNPINCIWALPMYLVNFPLPLSSPNKFPKLTCRLQLCNIKTIRWNIKYWKFCSCNMGYSVYSTQMLILYINTNSMKLEDFFHVALYRTLSTFLRYFRILPCQFTMVYTANIEFLISLNIVNNVCPKLWHRIITSFIT